MAEDQAVALYGLAKKQLESMNLREAELQKGTAALLAAVSELKGLPLTLSKQTSQYIAEGIRKSIADDFSRPIEAAVKAPLAELTSATYDARAVMRQVGKESRFHSWIWMLSLFLIGLFTGAACHHVYTMSKVDRIGDQLDSLQHQIAPPTPVPDAKPADGKAGKGKRGH